MTSGIPDTSGTEGVTAPPLTCGVPGSPDTLRDPREAALKKTNGKPGTRRECSLNRDMVFELWRDDTCHIISENYSYKTESYYRILRHELEGKKVRPSSGAVLDAYVVPICLERAHLAGIPVCEWGISPAYAPLPSVLYGLNYFANTAEYCIAGDEEQVKVAVRHLTNKGKYPFCYQKLADGATIDTCRAVFGKTAGKCRSVEQLAERVYELFAIPLVTMVTVSDRNGPLLSSLSPTRYSQLSDEERSLLHAYLNHQEFL